MAEMDVKGQKENNAYPNSHTGVNAIMREWGG
jgi:hypothetical protein